MEDAVAAKLIDENDIPKDIVKTLGNNNSEIIGTLLEDLIGFCKNHEDCVGLSKEKHEALKALMDFNYEKIYESEKVDKYKIQATQAMEELFHRLTDDFGKTERLKNKKDLPDLNIYEVLFKFINKIGLYEKLREPKQFFMYCCETNLGVNPDRLMAVIGIQSQMN